jgi:oligopeptide transport system ATP-binding protein
LTVPRGKTVALVGESGCGKTATALSILRLIPEPPGRMEDGHILFTPSPGEAPVDLAAISRKDLRRIRGNRIAMVFQEPMTALNPVFSVGEQIVEAIELHQPLRRRAAWARAVEMMRDVGIPDADRRCRDYPHQMSGGMKQRVMIAMALSCQPSLLIADEPTTALDVTIQQQILGLLRSIQARSGMSVLLITHDLGVVAEVADEAYVMYAGRIVEHASVLDLFANPLHPYTQGLLRSMPRLSQGLRRLETIPGSVPDPANYPSGCRFHPRCVVSADRARDATRSTVNVNENAAGAGRTILRRCVQAYHEEPSGLPELRELRAGHYVACWEVDRASNPQARAAI